MVKREVSRDKDKDRTGKDREVLNQIKVNLMTMILIYNVVAAAY